jgi:hypothetical protein
MIKLNYAGLVENCFVHCLRVFVYLAVGQLRLKLERTVGLAEYALLSLMAGLRRKHLAYHQLGVFHRLELTF